MASAVTSVFAAARTPRLQLLSEELFDDALVRERKRADRFEEPFVLFLLTIQGPRGPESWKQLIAALSQSAQDTDVIGWFRSIVKLSAPPVAKRRCMCAVVFGKK